LEEYIMGQIKDKVKTILIAGWLGYTKEEEDEDHTAKNAHVANVDFLLKDDDKPIEKCTDMKKLGIHDRTERIETEVTLRVQEARTREMEARADEKRAAAAKMKALVERRQIAQEEMEEADEYVQDQRQMALDEDQAERNNRRRAAILERDISERVSDGSGPSNA
jgi:hypothetical protein